MVAGRPDRDSLAVAETYGFKTESVSIKIFFFFKIRGPFTMNRGARGMKTVNPFDSKVSFILVKDYSEQDCDAAAQSPVPLSTTAQALFDRIQSDRIAAENSDAAPPPAQMACPRECGAVFDTDDIDTHMLSCPVDHMLSWTTRETLVSCPHLQLGCKFKGHREHVLQHLQACAYEPVKKVVRGHVNELRRLRDTFASNCENISELRMRLQAIEEEAAASALASSGVSVHRGQDNVDMGPASAVHFGGVGAVSAEEKTMQQWLPSKCTVVLNRSFEVHSEGICSLAHCPDLNRLFSGSLDRSIQVWDSTPHEPLALAQLRAHRGAVTALAVNTHRQLFKSFAKVLYVVDSYHNSSTCNLAVHFENFVNSHSSNLLSGSVDM